MHTRGTQSCFPMMCSVQAAAGWKPNRATVGLSSRISINACPMSCKNLLIDLYEPSPRSCLMTSRDSITRANYDLALTWPSIRYVLDEWKCIGLQQVLPAAHAAFKRCAIGSFGAPSTDIKLCLYRNNNGSRGDDHTIQSLRYESQCFVDQ